MAYSSEVINNKVILSNNSLYKDLNIKTSGISMWFERWFLSSNAKDIGVLYLIYALFSGLIGTAFSVLIRLELSGPGVQFIADNQLYNSIITAHAIIMIFFMVMPALIGGFGNFLLPLGLGGPDMGFPRLNNISYLSLIPSIVLFLFAGGIENGVGTGWTLNMEYSEQMIMLGGIKLFSMREYPLLFNGLRYSWLYKSYVKTLMTRGQYAWVAKKNFLTHQRLNKEYLVKNKKEWFEQWLVGMTDGEGTFGFYIQNGKWVLHYKIAQSRYNLRALYHIKTKLGIGTIAKGDGKAQILIRDKTKLNDVIFPIFDKYPLLTSKYFNYMKLKKAYAILTNPVLHSLEKDKLLLELKEKCIPESYRSPAWKKEKSMLKYETALDIMSKPWLSGFIEGEGSFYLVAKDSNIIVHGFAISQMLDKIVLNAIKILLHIPTLIGYKEKHNNYILDTTNSKAVENLISYFKDNLVGMKSLEYKIWARSYVKNKGNYDKLHSIREIISKIKQNLVYIHEIERTNDSFQLLHNKIVANAKLQNSLANNNPLLKNSTFNKRILLDCSINKHYHTKINTFSGNKGLLTDWIIPTSSVIAKFFFSWVTRIIIHKVSRGLYKNYSGFFNYLLNKFELYKLFNYIIIFVYSIYVNIDKIILTYKGLCFFIVFGVLTEDPFSYYETLWWLYSVSMLKNYLKLTKNVLCNHPTIKTFLIVFLDSVQGFLLGKILIGIITNILSFLKNVLGYILKTDNPNNNNPENNNPHSHNNEYNNNGKGPNNNSKILAKENDDDEDDRVEAYSSTYINKNTLTQYGEGVETNYDYKYRKISKVYWKNVFVDGKLKKQIEKTEYYDKKGVLYNSVLLKDGIEVAIYKHKKSAIYR